MRMYATGSSKGLDPETLPSHFHDSATMEGLPSIGWMACMCLLPVQYLKPAIHEFEAVSIIHTFSVPNNMPPPQDATQEDSSRIEREAKHSSLQRRPQMAFTTTRRPRSISRGLVLNGRPSLPIDELTNHV